MLVVPSAEAGSLLVIRNPKGQVSQIQFPDGQKVSYSYDASGHLSTKQFTGFENWNADALVHMSRPSEVAASSKVVLLEFTAPLTHTASVEDALDHFFSADTFGKNLKNFGVKGLEDLARTQSMAYAGEVSHQGYLFNAWIALRSQDASNSEDLQSEFISKTGIPDGFADIKEMSRARKVASKLVRELALQRFSRQLDKLQSFISDDLRSDSVTGQALSSVISSAMDCNPSFESNLRSAFDSKVTFLQIRDDSINEFSTFFQNVFVGSSGMRFFANRFDPYSDRKIIVLPHADWQNPGQPKEFTTAPSSLDRYFGDAHFNPSHIGDDRFNWALFELARHYASTQEGDLSELVGQTFQNEILASQYANFKGTKLADTVASFLRMKYLRPLQALIETSATYYAMDALAPCMLSKL